MHILMISRLNAGSKTNESTHQKSPTSRLTYMRSHMWGSSSDLFMSALDLSFLTSVTGISYKHRKFKHQKKTATDPYYWKEQVQISSVFYFRRKWILSVHSLDIHLKTTEAYAFCQTLTVAQRQPVYSFIACCWTSYMDYYIVVSFTTCWDKQLLQDESINPWITVINSALHKSDMFAAADLMMCHKYLLPPRLIASSATDGGWAAHTSCTH